MANPNISVDVSGNTAKLQQQINQVARKPLVIDVTSGRGGAQPLGRLTGQITEIDKSLAAANARVIAFGAAAGTIFALENAVASLFSTFVNTEKKLQDINVILNLTDKNLASFGSSLFGIAANTAQSFDIVAEAATELSRQGLGVEETLKRTEAALILTRLSGLDAAASVSALTSAINSFQNSTLEATEIVNKLANVDAAFAVSSADLANALARVGSSADDAGISFDELIALVTTAQQITARGGAVIGNSLKTIFTRLGRGKVQEVLGGLGISATDEQGQAKNQVQLLKELAAVYDTLSATQKNYVAEQVGGVFQINILKAALGDLGKEYSIYDRALKTSLSSTDQAIQRNEQLNQTLSALGSKTLANVQKAAASIGEGLFGDAARNVLNATNFLAEGVSTTDAESIGGQIGKGVIDGLGKFISGPGLALATGVFIKLLADFAKYGTEAFRSILGTNTAAKEQAIVQQNIAKFLQNNTGLYDSILKGQISVSSAAKEYLSVIQQQTAALQKQNAIAAAISKNLTGSVGIKTIGGQQFISSAKKGKTAATGYFPEAIEQANINARIGGANPSVDKPVTIPNFSLGGGKKGTITAHTGEWAVPNFAGGDGTAIFNRDMKKKYGLPKGARKISASGFIPNFAGYSYALSTFAGKGIKNPRAEKQFNKFFENKSFRNIERDDRISGVGFKIQKIKLTPQLQALYDTQPGSPAFTSQFEQYAVKKLGFIPSGSTFNGIKLYGGMSAAVDGYKINNGEAKFLEVKGGSFETLAVANKFGRVLPENLRRLPEAELSKLFKEGIPKKQDIVKLDNTLAIPDVRGARGGNFNRPFRVADIEANRSKNLIRASGFIPNFATKNVGKEITNLGDISANPKFASKIVSAIIPQPTKKLLKFSATAKYGDKTYAATGIPVSGPNPDVAKGLSKQNIPNLHRNIGKVLVDQANIFGQSLGATKFISSASELPNLGGVNSAAGVAFERGVQNAIGGSVSGSKRARVDFNSVNPKLKKIFNNAPGVYEAKNRPSPSLINDVFAKFLSRAKPGAVSLTNKAGIAQRAARVRELAGQGLSKVERNKILKREGLAANGFIPNFAAANLIKEINKRITNPNIAKKLSEGSGLSNDAYIKAAGKLGVNTSGLEAFLKQPGFPLRGKEKIAGLSRALGFSFGRSFNIDALKLGDWNYVKKSFEQNGLTKNDFDKVSKFAKSVRGENAFRRGFKSKAEGFIPNFTDSAILEQIRSKSSYNFDVIKTKPGVEKRINKLYQQYPDLQYLGSGAESHAFKSGNRVLKLPTLDYKTAKQQKAKAKEIGSIDWATATRQLKRAEPNLQLMPLRRVSGNSLVTSQRFAGNTFKDEINDNDVENSLMKLVESRFERAKTSVNEKPNWLRALGLDTGSSANFTFMRSLPKEVQIQAREGAIPPESLIRSNKVGLIDPVIYGFMAQRLWSEAKAKTGKGFASGLIPNSPIAGRNKFQAQWIKNAIKNKGLPEEVLRDPQIMSKLANIFRKKYPNEQSMFGFSNGFVPNFANNSTNKGIPVSKIRAHFDKAGNPVAVTNTIHEPNGLKDAIQREKRGIGMPGPIKASSGFIPNFVEESNPSETENAFSKLTAGLSSVALQLALFASIGSSQNQLSEENLKELEYVNKQKRSVERKALADQIKSARSEARSTTTAGLPSRQEALSNVKAGFQPQLEAQKGAVAPGLFQKQLSRVKGFRPGLGTAFVAPIIAETAANIIPQETQGGRAAASTVSGLGSIASYTAIGAQFGGKFGAGIGATIGIISTVVDVMNQFKSNIPELQAEAGKLQDSFSRTTENVQSLQAAYQKYEQLLESGASQEDLNKAQKNYLEFLTKFNPSEAKQFLGAIKSRGSAGIQEVGEAILRPQAQRVSSAEATANLEGVFKNIRSKDLLDVAFGSAGSFKEANKEQLSTLTEIAKAGTIQGKIGQELKKRVQELGGIDKVEENFSLLLREVFNLNTEDIIAIQGSPEFKKQLQEVLKNALQEGLDLADISISGLNAQPVKQNINKKLNEITQEILDGIDLDLTYNAKTSPLKALEDQFFSGEITREQFIGQRSKERLDFASELGLKPEEISKRFGTDIQNVANLFGNLKAQEAADLGLGQKIQERAREVATAKTASEYGMQNVAPENVMTTFLNDLKNLVAKGSITPAEASSRYQGAKESSNLTTSIEDLRKNLSGIKPQNGLEKIGMDLVGSTSIALRNFQLAETSSGSIAQNLEKVASLLEKQIDLLNTPKSETLNQPVTEQSETKESGFSFSLSSPSISIVSQSDGQILEELDTKLNQGNQRILDEVRGIIQNVKAKNGLK